jgi:Fe(3+) dicitrate transport protein
MRSLTTASRRWFVVILRVCIVACGLCAVQPVSADPASQADSVTEPDAYDMPIVEVVGHAEPQAAIVGGASAIPRHELEATRPLTTNEALRKLPGVNVRDEEGLGLRPNIGVRGLNPTRSTKVTLLEDGVPLAYAPYGDNASYYHPPIERFAGIELLTGVEQLRFGPQTVGGTINYRTPSVRDEFGGHAEAAVGENGIGIAQLELGGSGMLLDLSHKQADGARDNMHSRLEDASYKAVVHASNEHAFTFRANVYTEDSQLTYSGLTLAEFQNFGPSYNPFANDEFTAIRSGGSVTHRWSMERSTLTTNLYAASFDRDWWRQSSTTTDTQCGTPFRDARLAGTAVDPDLCNSTQGRLREYYMWGVEPRLDIPNALGELQLGLKVHHESQDRLQVNATSPDGRTGTVVEDNLRRTDAWSAFVFQRFELGAWMIAPGLRFEHIENERTNRLTSVTGSDALDELIPGIGVSWSHDSSLTVFVDAHEGFAPPRTEDVISGTGTSTDVAPEKSLNFEAGVRYRRGPDVELQAAVFRNDFERLTAVGSIAGGSTPLAQGEALFAGVELAGGLRFADAFELHANYTWVPTAEQTSPFVQVVGGAPIAGSAAGLRQPYSPEHLLTASLAGNVGRWSGAVEVQHVSEQFTDFANTIAVSADGQRGVIDAATVWSATVDRAFGAASTTRVFLAVKNLTDEVYVVDRTRGIQVGMPRLVEVGLRFEF